MSDKAKILVVDDLPTNVRILHDRLQSDGFAVVEASSGSEALERVRDSSPDLILLDIVMPGMDGYEVLERLKGDETLRHIPVIVISAVDQLESVVRCLELGADDYLGKPFNSQILRARIGACLERKSWHDRENSYRRQIEKANEQLEHRVTERTAELRNALEEVEKLKSRLEAENVYLQQEIKLVHDFEQIVSVSAAYKKLLGAVEQVAGTDATVLILGETGTGKELLARAVHSISARKDRPLVKVNCATLPATLIESELFGHEKGAFTGAESRRIGRFELADGSTIFLDEVAELPIELQPKLLRVLQEGEFERLGSANTLKANVRVIAATNRDLAVSIGNGTFREDLFYRLNVFPLRCPPLRERKEDIPVLVEHFIGKYGARIGRKIERVPQRVMDALQLYDWPGNVRELENAVERGMIMSRGAELEAGDWIPRRASAPGASLIPTLEDKEREHISQVLDVTGWRVRGESGAAEILGVKPTTLEARMKKLGIVRKR